MRSIGNDRRYSPTDSVQAVAIANITCSNIKTDSIGTVVTGDGGTPTARCPMAAQKSLVSNSYAPFPGKFIVCYSSIAKRMLRIVNRAAPTERSKVA